MKIELDLDDKTGFISEGGASVIRQYDIVRDAFIFFVFKGDRRCVVTQPYDMKDADELLRKVDRYLDSPNYPGRP